MRYLVPCVEEPVWTAGGVRKRFQEGIFLVLLGWTTLTFTVKLRYQSTIWTVYLGVYPFFDAFINLLPFTDQPVLTTRGYRVLFK